MSKDELIITGARQNNLKDINLRLPHNKVIVITGVSGSGKSSLAFDTIFAEGQWRFIESLSTYARLFLEKLDRPDVDSIQNIRPAIALEQKNPVRGSHSTVGTLTELHDLFRLLYAKVAAPFCPECGAEIRKWGPSQIISELLEKYTGGKAIIMFDTMEPLSDLHRRGFQRIWVDGEMKDSDELCVTGNGLKDKNSSLITHHPSRPFSVVLDRLVLRDEPRLSDSIEMAWREGQGRLKVVIIRSQKSEVISSLLTPHLILSFSSENSCDECGTALPLPTPLLFSFNHPVGACPECKGFGNTLRYDEDLIIPDKTLSLSEGAVDPWNKPAYTWWKRQMIAGAKKSGLDVKKPLQDFTPEEKEKAFKENSHFHGLDDFFKHMEGRKYKLHVRVFLSRYKRAVTCPVCQGKRLNKEALSYKLAGLDISGLCRMPVSECLRFFTDVELSPFKRDIAKELVRQIIMKLRFLEKVGLEYLTLERCGKTLSGGEYQRINLSNQLASLLTGTLYVLDEPTVGLHPRDTGRILLVLRQLADLGNTVIVVEHDRGIIESAEWVVELGPGGGHKGGEVVFSGPAEDFLKTDCLTARYMKGIEQVESPAKKREFSGGMLVLSGAAGNNLKAANFSVPLKRLTAVTGVSGSGKSSLVVDTLYRALAKKFRTGNEPSLPYKKLEGDEYLNGVKLIDQSPIGRSPRSNPVTYLKIFEHIRKLFSAQKEAKAYGYGPGFFSFNVSGGRCETCKGSGYELMEMYFFEDLYIKCEKCNGKRYRPEALRITYRHKSIHDILNMTVEEACALFEDQPSIIAKLRLMMDTGLGYLRLGQPATMLSGGEDEPTVGLHFADVQALLNILNRLVETGNTVVLIEHNLDIVKAADWIVDLGPEGGDKGGRIIFEGAPDDIVKAEGSYTGKYLKTFFDLSIEKS
ncbi:MAG: excinuclease ABC subunit A [Nitrospira bacterium HGW-Nitrospira-1]|nr:MAG: excinuclease ABC subunit A [Nitrospira bacterium HGW-Nitrospira-1]